MTDTPSTISQREPIPRSNQRRKSIDQKALGTRLSLATAALLTLLGLVVGFHSPTPAEATSDLSGVYVIEHHSGAYMRCIYHDPTPPHYTGPSVRLPIGGQNCLFGGGWQLSKSPNGGGAYKIQGRECLGVQDGNRTSGFYKLVWNWYCNTNTTQDWIIQPTRVLDGKPLTQIKNAELGWCWMLNSDNDIRMAKCNTSDSRQWFALRSLNSYVECEPSLLTPETRDLGWKDGEKHYEVVGRYNIAKKCGDGRDQFQFGTCFRSRSYTSANWSGYNCSWKTVSGPLDVQWNSVANYRVASCVHYDHLQVNTAFRQKNTGDWSYGATTFGPWPRSLCS